MSWPRLRADHPGYFVVASEIIGIHLGLAVDALINHHGQPEWHYVERLILLVGASMTSIAAFRENPVNPAMRVVEDMSDAR